MASEPVRSTAVIAAPKDYSIPSAQVIQLLSVTASFTDNGAASDWLPAVVIMDNNGNALCRATDQGVKVTAGSDAEVSWFPGVNRATSSTTPTTTRLPWCLAEGDLTTNGSLPSYFDFATKDTSDYQLDAGSSHVQIIGAGTYRVTVSAAIESGTLGAATVLDLDCAFTAPHGINYLQNIGSTGWVSIGHALGGTPIWNCIQQFVVSNNAGNTHTLDVSLTSNPAAAETADHYVEIERIDDPYGSPL